MTCVMLTHAHTSARDATIKKLESSDNAGSSKKVSAMQDQFKIVIEEKEKMGRGRCRVMSCHVWCAHQRVHIMSHALATSDAHVAYQCCVSISYAYTCHIYTDLDAARSDLEETKNQLSIVEQREWIGIVSCM